MSRKASKRVSFSPDPEANDEPIFPKHGGLNSSRHVRKRVVVGILSFGFRFQKSSPARLLRRIGARVVKTLRFISLERKCCSSSSSRSSTKVSSSSSCSSSNYLARSRSVAESESHRAEAIEDCIEFLNSSSSLSRSNSVSACSC